MLKKWIPIFGMIIFTLSISSVLGATGNETSDSAIVNYRYWIANDTNCYSKYACGGEPNRTVCNITEEGSCGLCSLEGEVFNGTALITQASTCQPIVVIDNVERKNFNILIKVFPEPAHDCFGNFTPYNCNISDWNPVVKLRLPTGKENEAGVPITNYVEIDTSPCWNWWNSSDEVTRTEQSKYCPVGSIYITSDVDMQRIEFMWGNGTGADTDYAIAFLGYSTSIVNIEEKISPSLKSVMESVSGLIKINLDLWKIGYYLFLIISIIIAVVVIVGFLPLALKWILKKITS